MTAVVPGPVPAADRIRIAFEGIGTVDVPRGFFDEHDGPGGRRDVGVDHAYAVTSYAVQGATYAVSTSRIDERASRSEAYVDITRGRRANHLFLTRTADALDGEHLPKVPPPPIADSVARRLGESGPERVALELDPAAAEVGASATGPSRAVADDRARRSAARRAGELAVHRPPLELVQHLPARSDLPFLAARWDDTVEAIVRYQAYWRPGPDAGLLGWAVGAPIQDGLADAERSEVVSGIADLSAATAREDLARHGWDQLPPWAELILEQSTERGACRIDAGHLAALYQRVHAYRQGRGLVDEDGDLGPCLSILGDPPADPAERALHDLLLHELELEADLTAAASRGLA